MGDNLRGSLDKVTNVEAFEGGAGSASWGHDLALLRLLQVSDGYFTLVLFRVLCFLCLVLYSGTFCALIGTLLWYFFGTFGNLLGSCPIEAAAGVGQVLYSGTF